MLTVDWIDRGRSPRNPPNPLFPKGIDMDVTFGAARFCSTLLPYPAKRCGYFVVRCTLCKTSIVITTAGRADDARSLKIACLPTSGEKET